MQSNDGEAVDEGRSDEKIFIETRHLILQECLRNFGYIQLPKLHMSIDNYRISAETDIERKRRRRNARGVVTYLPPLQISTT